MAKKKWADIKAAHRNSRHEVTLVMDTASATEARRLAARLGKLPDGDPQAKALAKKVRDLEERAAASEIVFVFEGLGRYRHELMVAEHAPTAEQIEQAPEGMTVRWNPETFPPALAAASCVEPAEIAGDVDEWTEIHREWSRGQWTLLWGACMAANEGVVGAPKSEAVSDVLKLSGSR